MELGDDFADGLLFSWEVPAVLQEPVDGHGTSGFFAPRGRVRLRVSGDVMRDLAKDGGYTLLGLLQDLVSENHNHIPSGRGLPRNVAAGLFRADLEIAALLQDPIDRLLGPTSEGTGEDQVKLLAAEKRARHLRRKAHLDKLRNPPSIVVPFLGLCRHGLLSPFAG